VSTSIASRPKLARICLALQVFLIHFALERGYVAENVTGRDAGEHDIAGVGVVIGRPFYCDARL
jgi:hypothetical protein